MPLKHGALSGRARVPERSQRPKARLGTLLALTIAAAGGTHACECQRADARHSPLERAGGADARQTTGERTKGEKSGTRIGMVDETARRRLIVEDLMKAGLSVRMISSVTDIPRSSVHRAMRAIVRAEAKKEVAIAEIAAELLGERPPHGRRGRR